MTIGELYELIEDLLRRHDKPLPLAHIARFVFSATDATAYDVAAAVSALVRAGRLDLVENPSGDAALFQLAKGAPHV